MEAWEGDMRCRDAAAECGDRRRRVDKVCVHQMRAGHRSPELLYLCAQAWRRGWSLCFFSNVVSSWALGKWQAQENLSSFFGLEHEK